jgi:hypothetical protein
LLLPVASVSSLVGIVKDKYAKYKERRTEKKELKEQRKKDQKEEEDIKKKMDRIRNRTSRRGN